MSDDPELHAIRQRLAGFHFAQEALSKGEREILHLGEAALKRHDAERTRRQEAEAQRDEWKQLCETEAKYANENLGGRLDNALAWNTALEERDALRERLAEAATAIPEYSGPVVERIHALRQGLSERLAVVERDCEEWQKRACGGHAWCGTVCEAHQPLDMVIEPCPACAAVSERERAERAEREAKELAARADSLQYWFKHWKAKAKAAEAELNALRR